MNASRYPLSQTVAIDVPDDGAMSAYLARPDTAPARGAVLVGWDCSAFVSIFYGGWIPTRDLPLSRPAPTLAGTPRITGHVQMFLGTDDPLIPAAQRRQISPPQASTTN